MASDSDLPPIFKLFYLIKPLIPRPLQVIMRKMRFKIKRRRFKGQWPIQETAGGPPSGWKGWPENKKFALVLTHDVEWLEGCKKCLDLMNLERDLGFISSFYFVPERYENSLELHETLRANGFEVGIHGLNHDGRLYHSYAQFHERAARINNYLAQWKASGFRSPCMHHNLQWLHELNVEYDASTYDFDPFEPQGGGVGTIFPFIVTDASGIKKPYVELPYTLPQDFLLYVLMEEKTIDIWKKKLDWIVQKGGMVLLDTHPDYMNFNSDKSWDETYPAELYAELLRYIRDTYEKQYWCVLARDMARFWLKTMNNFHPY